jgi:hypothetical protein
LSIPDGARARTHLGVEAVDEARGAEPDRRRLPVLVAEQEDTRDPRAASVQPRERKLLRPLVLDLADVRRAALELGDVGVEQDDAALDHILQSTAFLLA